jgi:hypothetical protein
MVDQKYYKLGFRVEGVCVGCGGVIFYHILDFCCDAESLFKKSYLDL